MPKPKTNIARKATLNEMTQSMDDTHVSAQDYANNMFQDGNNRVANIKHARAYDEAAHANLVKDDEVYGKGNGVELLLDDNLEGTQDRTPEMLLDLKQDTSHSRDGTDASGSLDESGGFLGGTTQEVDDLEATAMPVDKIPHMND